MIKNKRWHGGAMAWEIGIAILFSAALIGYAILGNELPQATSLPIAIKVSIGLLIGPALAIWLSYSKIKNFKAAVAVLCVSSFIFIYGLLGIYTVMGETRSTKAVSAVITKEIRPNETIVSYGEV